MRVASFTALLAANDTLRGSTWLVVGKGPSFDRIAEIDTGAYTTIGINHVCERIAVEFLHVMDLDVVLHLGATLSGRARHVVVPRHMHVGYRLPGLQGNFHRAGSAPIEQLAEQHPVLGQLAREQRLFCYEASTAPPEVRAGTTVAAGPFSAATVIELLGTAGVRRVRTIGVDGGTQYAGAFAALADTTRLDAGQESYDEQFAAIARSIRTHALDCGPVDAQVPMRVFVGAQPEQEIPLRVLEHSIREHASISVEVVSLHEAIAADMPDYARIVEGLPQGTPFSLQRFAIPELCARSGRAIYLDSDMLVAGDLRELWCWPMEQGGALAVQAMPDGKRAPQLSVLVIDCVRAGWDIRAIARRLRADPEQYAELLRGAMDGIAIERGIPYRWNSLELFEPGRTRLLHFTDMRDQPWLSWRNPRAATWCAALRAAIGAGAVDAPLVAGHVARGWLRPSLLEQLERGHDDPLLLDARLLRDEEASFLPPHMQPAAGWLRAATGFGDPHAGGLHLALRRGLARLRFVLARLGFAAATRTARGLLRKIRRAWRAGRQAG